MRSPETDLTTPLPSAINTSPESRAARASMPVPTKGASGMMSGTACFCMFRSEEHTSELQSLPTRRSSDLVALSDQHVARVQGGARFHAGAHEGCFGHDERHGLLLHVQIGRAHV